MSTFIPTDAQAKAIAAIKSWFLHDTRDKQVFCLFGFAGVGKSTLVKHTIAELGLLGKYSESGVPAVLYACYTGKAAYVLRKKGTPAKTIHSLIYSVSEATEAQLKEATEELRRLDERVLMAIGTERLVINAQIAAQQMLIKEMHRPQYRLNEKSDVHDCRLLVLDEVSMVDDEMAAHILSFGKPVLVLGDPGQLPPIRGTGAFTLREPDVMLTEIHRQAAESAIIRLATMARTGQEIPYGEHDAAVWKMRRGDLNPEQMLIADQVICGRNATRHDLNNSMRRASGFEGILPVGPEEKIICLKNDNNRGLINGMFLSLDQVNEVNEHRFLASVKTEDGVQIGGVVNDEKPTLLDCYAGYFLDHERLDQDRHDRDWKIKKGLVETTFGYAITCHKAQGSQWQNIIVWDDRLSRTQEDRARWLYTAITRAESGLVILD